MELRLKVVENVAVCELSGVHTHRDLGTLRATVNHALGFGLRNVVIDFREVTSLDAEAVGELIAVYATVKRANGMLVLSAVSHRVRYLLATSGLDSVFATADTRDSAIAAAHPDSSLQSPPRRSGACGPRGIARVRRVVPSVARRSRDGHRPHLGG